MTQKKFCFVFFIFMAGVFLQTNAQTVEVSAMDSFSTAEPPKSISVKLEEDLSLSQDQCLYAGTVLSGELVDVVSPKRLKRNATFSFKPMSFVGLNGEKHNINSDIKATYTTTVNKGKLAQSAALSVGNHFVKGLSMGVAAVEGAVKNEEGNRLKSSVTSMYESSPFSYANKGEDLYFEIGQCFYLKFPKVKEADVPSDEVQGQNYSFTIEKE